MSVGAPYLDKVRVPDFQQEPISNHCNHLHQGFKERHYIAALQLRANIYLTQESLNRGWRGAVVQCRRCNTKYESCSHILGQCPVMQSARIARHDNICDILVAEAQELEWEVHKEQRLFTEQGKLRKLDLVFRKSDTALVVNVTMYACMDEQDSQKKNHSQANGVERRPC